MKLENSEVLFLSQILFYVRASDSVGLKLDDKLDQLYEKLSNHLVHDFSENNDTLKNVSHDNYSLDEQGDCPLDVDCQRQTPDYKISTSSLFLLSELFVESKRAPSKQTFRFVEGISKCRVDVELDFGDEIICDVEHVIRFSNSIHVETIEGWCIFDVDSFPEDWVAQLPLGALGVVV